MQHKVRIFKAPVGDDEEGYIYLEKNINEWLKEQSSTILIHKMYLTGEPQTFFIWYSETQPDRTESK